MKKAVVTGITGQDGYYMAKLLSEKGYDIIGLAHGDLREKDSDLLCRKIEFDLNDYNGLIELIKEEKPDEFYNFAAQSSSILSWENTVETCVLNFLAPTAILQGIRDYAPDCHFFQASSAEIFGKNPADVPQSEMTQTLPGTPYATAKVAIGNIIDNYRNQYGIFAVNGIFYNHESIRRKETFLPAKIARTVAAIRKGDIDCLYVGNINSKRDWGYAPDYMQAAWEVMQLKKSDNYIFASGVMHTVREMIEIAFSSVGIHIKWEGFGKDEKAKDISTGQIVVQIDEKFYREYDRCDSIGNPSKLYNAIKWRPSITFERMIAEMTNYFV